jgi:hypothetical protein
MNRSKTIRLTALLALCVVLLAGAAGAAERLLVPEELDVPFYLRGLGHTADNAWAAVVFYRPMENAPGDIAVGEFVSVDPEQYPSRFEGFAVVPESGPPPLAWILWNRPDEVAEICFVSGEEYLAARSDGRVTISELLNMDSLMVGYVDSYREIQQPSGRDVPGVGWNLDIIASGVLEDGTPFFVRSVYNAGTFNVDFRFGD